ncbi:MAG: excinuclease ABC subunit UvrA, partial [Acetobacteraceae bacterium]
LHEIGAVPALNRKLKHEIEAVVDRVVVREGIAPRLADSFEAALGLSDGVVYGEDADSGERTVFSSRFACPVSGFTIEEIEPRLFSFNSPHGACPTCDGLGTQGFFDPALVVPDERCSLAEGVIAPWSGAQTPYYDQTLQSLARHFKVPTRAPWGELPASVRAAILFGTAKDEPVALTYKDGVRAYTVTKPFEGVIRNLERRFRESDSAWVREELSRYQAEKPCAVCNGARLKPEALAVKVGAKNIAEISDLSIRHALAWFQSVSPTLTPQRLEIARRILREIGERLQFLVDVGLDYLTLARGSATLSGGESQRIRLASQIGSGLTGVLYVLDEPSIGLHQRDNARLLGTLRRLKALGNTVLVVEHDEDAIRAADHLIDMGPLAGVNGGHVVALGTPAEVAANPKSLTGD